MASSATKSCDLAMRTVHIKMHPTPRTFAERREVLRVLERFGEVTMFRSYKYHPKAPLPNSFLSLFASPTSANEIINASPIRYRLITTTPQINSSQPSSSSSLLLDPTTPNPEPSSRTATGTLRQEEHHFELSISPSNFSHAKWLTSVGTNPLHGPFVPIHRKTSFMGSSLERIMPASLWSAGLADWDTDPIRHRVTTQEAGEEDEGQGNKSDGEMERKGGSAGGVKETLGGAKGFSERERKRRENALPRVMRGPVALKQQRGPESTTREQDGGL